MPENSACIGSSELDFASIATWPSSYARAIQVFSSSSERMVWYFARSTGVLRATPARASASEAGVPLRLEALSLLSPLALLGAPPAALSCSLASPITGEGGVGVFASAKPAPDGGG